MDLMGVGTEFLKNSKVLTLRRGRGSMGVHFSSATDEWTTPQQLFDELSWIYGGFTLDPCATATNAKCAAFFTRAEDGLSQRWEGKVFLNPPYGRDIGKWVRKAFEESLEGALVVCLLPARTDTRWWQDYGLCVFSTWTPEIRPSGECRAVSQRHCDFR